MLKTEGRLTAPVPDAPCYSCGIPVPVSAARCPSCGAPVRTLAPARGSGRPKVAGFLLLSLFGLIVFQSIVVWTDPGASLHSTVDIPNRSFAIAGTVVDPAGAPVANASVLVPDIASVGEATTDDSGGFRLTGLPAGYVALRVDAAGYGPAEVRLFLTADQQVRVPLRVDPALHVINHASYRTLLNIVGFCGVLLIGIGLLTLAGALAAYRRRNYRLAVTAGVVGAFGSPPISLVLGIIVVILVVRARAEFA